MSAGSNIQYLRQLCGNMTQETLAEKLNVSRQTVSKWENDEANPELEKALNGELSGLRKERLRLQNGDQDISAQNGVGVDQPAPAKRGSGTEKRRHGDCA